MSAPSAMGARIIGLGTALPDGVRTNAELESRLDTSDDWITERTGIKERRIGGTTGGLAAEAGRQALESAGVDPASIDMLILCTTSPDRTCPASASRVQHLLGLTCGAFDVNAACSGFMYGLVAANGFIRMGANRVLVIGAETLSRITDPDDRGTVILFGDGAGAAVVDKTEGEGSVLGWDTGSDGSLEHILYAEVGGYLQMDGKEVFRRAVRVMVQSAEQTLARAGAKAEDVALVVPHQANIRIIESACNKLGIPMDRVATVLASTGNTSSASIPLALADGIAAGRAKEGDLVLLVGFGAGMTWASALLRWSPLNGPVGISA